MSTLEHWEPGSSAWFEYHCNESDESPDAPAWHRSHQQVTVLAEGEHDGWPGSTYDERVDAGQPKVYSVRFPDGLEWTAFEDELLTDPADFDRPDPPTSTPLTRSVFPDPEDTGPRWDNVEPMMDDPS
jgi:hypothetical protein